MFLDKTPKIILFDAFVEKLILDMSAIKFID